MCVCGGGGLVGRGGVCVCVVVGMCVCMVMCVAGRGGCV